MCQQLAEVRALPVHAHGFRFAYAAMSLWPEVRAIEAHIHCCAQKQPVNVLAVSIQLHLPVCKLLQLADRSALNCHKWIGKNANLPVRCSPAQGACGTAGSHPLRKRCVRLSQPLLCLQSNDPITYGIPIRPKYQHVQRLSRRRSIAHLVAFTT